MLKDMETFYPSVFKHWWETVAGYLWDSSYHACSSPSGRMSMQILSLKTEEIAARQKKRHSFFPHKGVSDVVVVTEDYRDFYAFSFQKKLRFRRVYLNSSKVWK